MKSKSLMVVLGCLSILLFAGQVSAEIIIINFDDLGAGPLDNQYESRGVTFSNTTVILSDPASYPAHSGGNLAFNDKDPIEISFVTPVYSIEAYFTRVDEVDDVTLSFYGQGIDGPDTRLGVRTLSPNLDPDHWIYNEQIYFEWSGGISRVSIADGMEGQSFTMDDLTFSTTPVPEPATLLLVGFGILGLAGYRRRARNSREVLAQA
jgi:hypothetical protein